MILLLRRLYQKHWWLTPITIFIIWRLGLELVARITLAVSPDFVMPWRDNPNPPPWARWDSGWFYSIVHYGYSFRPGVMSNVNFFPLYPLIWKVVESILRLPSYVNGLLVSNVLAGGSFLVLYRWAQESVNTIIARKTLIALALFPTSFFLISAYSESTLLFCSTLVLLGALKRKWLLAALAAGLGSAARPVGIFLAPLLIGLWITANHAPERRYGKLLLAVLLSSSGLILFSGYLWHRVGTPWAWFQSQVASGHEFIGPHHLLFAYLKDILTQGEHWRLHLVELATIIFIITHIRMLWRFNPNYAIFALLPIILMLFSNTLTAIQRFTLMIVPLFFAIAHRRRRFWVGYAIITIPLLLYATYRFVMTQWVA